jgi:aryl-alcohol dehydrogenase-like predicted oxidoreductase
VQTRKIGKEKVSAIGLGAMPLSIEGRPDEDRAIRTIHAALDAGITLIDTADSYCLNPDEHGHNERLVAKALAGHRDRNRVLVATKGGHLRPGDGSWTRNGHPEYLKQACEASLQRLGVDAIGLYQFHRPDPEVPFVESVGALADLRAEGKIRMIGVSNVNIDQIRHSLDAGAVSVQNQFSPRFRSSEGELVFCGEHRLAFLAYSPLGGIRSAGMLGERHRAFADVASEHGVSPQQVALAWMLAKGNHVIPIPGSSRPDTITDSAAAIDLKLSRDDMERLDRL